MNLRHWSTNSDVVLQQIAPTDKLSVPDDIHSVLGLAWNRTTDSISLKLSQYDFAS